MSFLGSESPAEYIIMVILLIQLIFLWGLIMFKMGKMKD
jgi:hypothetical protein